MVGELPQDHGAVVLHQTNDKYAKTMSIRIVRGRYFTEQDAIACLNFAVVNEAFVRRFLAGRDPLGGSVRAPGCVARPSNLASDASQIVGVLGDTPNRIQTNQVLPEIYIPYLLRRRGPYLRAVPRSAGSS